MTTDAVLALLQEAADTCILPRFQHLTSAEVMEKNPGDLVTVADREAEVLITERLNREYPDAVVLGEEAYAADPGLLDRFAAAEHAFTLDPVDGTRNFVHGRPQFAVMASEIFGGSVERAWIWQPLDGAAWVAEKGKGVTLNGVPVPPPAVPDDPRDWRGLTARPSWKEHGDPAIGALDDSYWCCGYDYPALLRGDAHYVLYVHGAPWDHAPGSMMVRELGGATRLWDGEPWTPSQQQRGSITAASPRVADSAFAALQHLWA